MNLPDLSGYGVDELEAIQDDVTQRLVDAYAAGSAEERAAEEEERHLQRLGGIAAAWRRRHGGIGSPEDPVPWVMPEGSHDVWPAGSWVTHDGVTYTTQHHANSWEPGTPNSQWVRQDEPDEDGLIPWAAGQWVEVDDLRTHDGRIWRAKQDHETHVGWEPSIHTHAVWEDMGPVDA